MATQTDNATPDYVQQREQLQAKIDVHHLQKVDAAIEASKGQPRQVTESYGDDVIPKVANESGWHDSPLAFAYDYASDRANGDNWPIFNGEHDLSLIRGMAHALSHIEYGEGVLGALTNYVVHTGYSYRAVAKRGQQAPERLVAECQRLIDAFLANNDWELDFEEENFRAGVIEGEAILCLDTDGRDVQVRRAEPSWLTQPAITDYLERKMNAASHLDWKYGIASTQGNPTEIHGYFVQWNADESAWRMYPKDKVTHLKFNVPRHVKRGLSDFYPVEKRLAGSSELLRRMMTGAGIQASIALVVSSPMGQGLGLSPGQSFNSFTDGGSGLRPKSGGGVATERFADFRDGTVVNTKGDVYTAGPMAGTQAANFIQVLQAGLRSVGVRWNMPEHMVSGDASNNNYASILEAGAPFTRCVDRCQQKHYKAYERLIWSVLRSYFLMGMLDLRRYGMNWTDLKNAINVIVEGTSPAIRDKAADYQVDSDLHAKGLVSDETLATKYDYDYSEEQERGAKPTTSPTALSSPLQRPHGGGALESARRGWEGIYP